MTSNYQIGIFYGTTSQTTENIADSIEENLKLISKLRNSTFIKVI